MAQYSTSSGIILLIIILLIGVSIAVLAINNQHLSDVAPVCWVYGIFYNCVTYIYGCLITEDYDNPQPCNYCYSVGSISLFVQLIALVIQACVNAVAWSFVTAVFNIIWWAVAGSFFTKKWHDARDLPLDNWRHAIMALCWTAVSLAAVQLLLCIAACATDRKDKSDTYIEPRANCEMCPPPPPPPQPAYPPTAYPPPGYPQPIPQAGYPPAGYPPAPYQAGYPQALSPAPYPAGYPAPPPPGPYPAGYAPTR